MCLDGNKSVTSPPAFGRVFCYNNTREKKNFSPMKLLAKVVLGLLAYNYVKNDLRTPTIKKIGRVQNCEPYQIPNNGGL